MGRLESLVAKNPLTPALEIRRNLFDGPPDMGPVFASDLSDCPQLMVQPPFTLTVWPVM
jgi:hypothetical protein